MRMRSLLHALLVSFASASHQFTFHEGPISWEAAVAACEATGDRLASIHSEAENAAAYAVTSGRRAYIALNDRANEGSFVWADGTPFDFSRWGAGEPNSFGATDEDCAGFHTYFRDGGWNDFPCSGDDRGEPIGYVCRSTRPLPPSPPPLPSATFSFHHEPAKYSDARRICQTEGGDLASIHSARENADAFALTRGATTWIGYSDAVSEGSWVWADGTSTDYTNWAPGEPNGCSPPLTAAHRSPCQKPSKVPGLGLRATFSLPKILTIRPCPACAAQVPR